MATIKPRKRKRRSDGDRHEAVGLVGAIVLAGLAAHWGTPSVAVAAVLVSGVFANYWLSPDLDFPPGTPGCNAKQRWRRIGLAWWWDLYAIAARCHRSAFSHAPVIGTLGRLAFLSPLWLPVLWLYGTGDWVAPVGLGVLAGVEVNGLIHYAIDGTLIRGWYVPGGKRRKH